MAHTNLQRFGVPPRSPATAQSQESLPPSNPSFLFRLFSRRSDIFLFFALFCLFLTGLSDPLSTPTAAFSVHPQPYLEHIFFQKVKKTGTPANIPVSPKSLNLHTACMHVSAFVSVCFVCGIPDDALSYIFCMTVKFNPALCVTECRSLVCELLFVYSSEYISELLFCQDNFLILFFYRIRQRSGSL